MRKTINEFMNMFKDIDTNYELHIQIYEHFVHIHSDDSGSDILYNLVKDFDVELIKFSQYEARCEFCFKY